MSQPFLGILSKRRPVVALVRYIRIRQAVGVTGYIGFDDITAISGGINVAGVDTLQIFTVSGLVPYVPPLSFTVANATL